MANYLVFYGAQLYGEYSQTEYINCYKELPEGSYLYTPDKTWYLRQWGSLTPINLCDLSKEVRMYCLIMGIQL